MTKLEKLLKAQQKNFDLIIDGKREVTKEELKKYFRQVQKDIIRIIK